MVLRTLHLNKFLPPSNVCPKNLKHYGILNSPSGNSSQEFQECFFFMPLMCLSLFLALVVSNPIFCFFALPLVMSLKTKVVTYVFTFNLFASFIFEFDDVHNM